MAEAEAVVKAWPRTKPKYVEDSYTPPSDVKVEVDGSKVRMSGKLGSLEYDFNHTGAELRSEDSKIIIKIPGSNRRSEALLGTIISKLKNMATGVTQGYTYKLKIISSHFPITVKTEGKRVVIENFLGERYKRYADIVGSAKVTVKGEDVIVTGINKEDVGQTAANIENACRIKKKDPRKFLDGIYVYEKHVGME
ncbi:MAG: 50S ribosomal protein L6 [Aigarchaeota archaeon]|nr:50S ribosomal protein L6 [Candidatus Pelearchaeum maunauluense]